MQSIDAFQVRDAEAAKQFEEHVHGVKDPMMRATGKETFEAVAMLQAIQRQTYTPADGAEYPRGQFGQSMQQIAQLIKVDVGVEMAFADIGGLGPSRERGRAAPASCANRLTEFGQALAAFWQDMGDRMARRRGGHDVASSAGRRARTAIAARITGTPTACS